MQINELSPDPFKQFKQWLACAVESLEPDPHAFVLATATAQGAPSARMLLFKGLTEYQGHTLFTFYSNTCSQKGQDMAGNPQAEMLFYWASLYRQIRISGDIILLSREQTEGYFASRSLDSKLSALVSRQSQPIESRESLIQQIDVLKESYANKELPCPSYWQGYGLVAKRFEFWLGRDHRLHDRFSYKKEANADWTITRLSP